MQIQFIYKSAGKFSLLLIFWALTIPVLAQTREPDAEPNFRPVTTLSTEWNEFDHKMKEKKQKDRVDGISYVVSGTLALVGGLLGQGASKDPLEKGVYTLFQSIGVASIGFGIYNWKLGDEDRWFYDIVESAPSVSMQDRVAMVRSFNKTKASREKEQKFVRALTHGLIAALNIYGATQQTNESVKNALYFLGGVNTLAAISFTF